MHQSFEKFDSFLWTGCLDCCLAFRTRCLQENSRMIHRMNKNGGERQAGVYDGHIILYDHMLMMEPFCFLISWSFQRQEFPFDYAVAVWWKILHSIFVLRCIERFFRPSRFFYLSQLCVCRQDWEICRFTVSNILCSSSLWLNAAVNHNKSTRSSGNQTRLRLTKPIPSASFVKTFL